MTQNTSSIRIKVNKESTMSGTKTTALNASQVFYSPHVNGTRWSANEETATTWHNSGFKVFASSLSFTPWEPPVPTTPEEIFAAMQKEMAVLREEVKRLKSPAPAAKKKGRSRKSPKTGYGKKLLDSEKVFEEYFGSVKEALELMYEEGEPFTIRDVEELSPHAQPKSWSALKLSNTDWFKERFEDTGRKTSPERGNNFGRTIYVARNKGDQ